jgi:hypothetical protein
MANDEQYGPRPAWDRVGRFFEDVGRVSVEVYSRNLTLWGAVSQGLRSSDKYGADELARDTRKVLATALDNADDIWTTLTRPPERQEVATAMPTAFLYFGSATGGKGTAPIAGPVWIRLPPGELEGLSNQPQIKIDGPQAGIDALTARIRVTKVERQGYKIDDVAPMREKRLVPGFYGGIVYLTEPVRPLANLRIVVQ